MTKTILITGATDGIGLLTAKLLAADGHHILLHGRSNAKLAAAKTDVGGSSDGYVADLSRLSEVTALAKSVARDHPQIDVLINNAGVLKTAQTVTTDGLDVRFMVNTLAPYALTRALLAHIPKDGRIINLSSAAQAPVDFDVLAGNTRADDMSAYSQSKLAITIWSRALAVELAGGPMVLAVNPGSLLASKMVKEGFGIAGNDLMIGADLLRRTAVSEEFAKASGQYYDNDAQSFGHPHSAAFDVDHSAKVMQAIKDALARLA
ncbi:MAG: SDR family NAD(P)-dependent oxidoreductase [Sedimentitalea sp.]